MYCLEPTGLILQICCLVFRIYIKKKQTKTTTKKNNKTKSQLNTILYFPEERGEPPQTLTGMYSVYKQHMQKHSDGTSEPKCGFVRENV